MHFRLIILLLINFLFSQSLYKSTIGLSTNSYTAKSIALASTSSISERSALSIATNPSNIALNRKKGLSIISSYNGKSIIERRSIIVKDYFGEYLTEADYVKNSSLFNSLVFGMKYNLKMESFNLSVGLSAVPFNLFNYNYEEEVRGQLPSIDGSIFSRDPLLGYHIFDVNGSQRLYSLGTAFKLKIMNSIVASFGYGYNLLTAGFVNERNYVDTLLAIENLELALIDPYNITYDLKESDFASYGFNLRIDRILFNASLQDKAIISKLISSEDSAELNYYYSSIVNLYDSNELALHYFTDYLSLKNNSQIYKPRKYNISIAVLDDKKIGFNFIINYERNEYENHILNSYEKYRIAIEHIAFNNLPLRFGIQYCSSPFKPYISSSSIFSIGSGFNIYENLIFDYALNFKHINYMFPDLFPVEGEDRPDLDIINDSEINFIITMEYNF